MNSKHFKSTSKILKATRFWKENRVILKEFKNFPTVAILAISFSILSAIMAGFTVGLVGTFLQGLTNPNEPAFETGIQWIDTFILAKYASPSGRIFRLSIWILVFIWLRSVLLYLSQVYSGLAQINLGYYLRCRIFEQLQQLSLNYYSKTHTGELVSSITSETNQVQLAFEVASVTFSQGLTLLAYFIAMLLISWQLTVASILMFALLLVGINSIKGKVREASFKVPIARKHFMSVILEYIGGIRTVHASATQDFEYQKFIQANQQKRKAENELNIFSLVAQPLTQGILSTILIIIVLFAFNFLIINGKLSAAYLLTFLFALSRTGPVISQVSGAGVKISTYQGALQDLIAILRTDDKPYLKDGIIKFDGLKCSIDLVSVDFGYEPDDLVLHNVTLTIPCGQTTALVGASGAGKTTLAELLPRFYDPVRGHILIDGRDLREFQINTIRQKMAIVSQDTFIFNASVRDNIAYGVKYVDESRLRDVAKQANALDFILNLPNGFDTRLGDRGVLLSGGQRQRISIARALLRNPEILILDEATSALDSVTERQIQESLEELSKGRTVISVAHRLSTISRANKIVVLEKGQIVEQGTYSELLNRQGELWKYHQMQYQENH
jgi:subfamily B ATP-binding cassette protein MsbA